MNIDLLSLDFDGTLAHPDPSTEGIYYQVFKEYSSYIEIHKKFQLYESDYLESKPELKQKIRSFGKLDPEQTKNFFIEWNNERIKFMFPDLPEEIRSESIIAVLNLLEKDQKMVLYPEVLSVLKSCRDANKSINILSGNNQNYIKAFLEKNNILSYFDSILTPDFLKTEKKNMFSYYKNISVDQTKILHVGDDPELDYHWPDSLGLRTLWLKRENSRYVDDSIPKNKIITSLSELSQLL